MAGVTVCYFKNPTGTETAEQYFAGSEIHVSTNGVLVIRNAKTNKAIRAYSAGTWHTAKED